MAGFLLYPWEKQYLRLGILISNTRSSTEKGEFLTKLKEADFSKQEFRAKMGDGLLYLTWTDQRSIFCDQKKKKLGFFGKN